MRLALASSWFRPGTGPEAIAEGLQQVGVRGLFVVDPGARERGWREPLVGAGVVPLGVGADPEAGAADDAARFSAALATAVETASALKSPAVVVEGGRFAGRAGARLQDLERELRRAVRGAGGDPTPLRAEAARLRQAGAAKGVEAAARALHGPLKEGVPLAVRNGDGLGDVLQSVETGWLLDALPGLSLWFDPARAERAARLATGPALMPWLDAHAARVAGLAAHGLGSDLAGRAHPEDAGPDWGSLVASLPRRLTWVLDVSGTLSAADVRDAVRFLEAASGRA